VGTARKYPPKLGAAGNLSTIVRIGSVTSHRRMAAVAKRFFVILALAALVVGSGYAWRQADRESTNRSAGLDELLASQDTAVGFSASGFEDRTVTISAFTFGNEDRATEDAWLETLAHEKAEALYSRGFRRVTVSGNTISRAISVAPTAVRQESMQKGESGDVDLASLAFLWWISATGPAVR
jgi:hypothetical protein